MRITPLDIRKQEFRKSMRGLDPEEVYAFLSTVADEYEAVLNDAKALRERLLELDDKVSEYRNMEKTLRDTLLTAERVTVEAKDNARRESELIIKEAQLEADRAVRGIKEDAMHIRGEIKDLRRQRDSYIARMKMLVESHMKLLESTEREFAEDDKNLEVDKGSPEPTPTAPSSEKSPADSARPRPHRAATTEPRLAEAPPATPTPSPAAPRNPEPRQAAAPSDDAAAPRARWGHVESTAIIDAEPESPEFETLVDRVVDEQKAVLEEYKDEAAGESAERASSRWTLDKLKRDILSTRTEHDEDH